MNIAYICYITETAEQQSENPSVSGDKHAKGIIRGLSSVQSNTLDVFTVLPMRTFPRGKRLFPPRGTFSLGERVRAHYVPYVNLPVLKQITILCALLGKLLAWAFRTRNEPQRTIMSYNLLFTIALPAWWISLLCLISFVPQMADPPIAYLVNKRGVSAIFRRIDAAIARYILRRIQNVLVLTCALAEDFAPQADYRVYYCGTEHFKIRSSDWCFSAQKEVVYLGGLQSPYLIPLLLDAFVLLDPSRYALSVYGQGIYAKNVEQVAQQHVHIQYKGYVDDTALELVLEQADLLVSPKDPADPLVPYTFSSKLLDYLVSGTPILMTATPEAPMFKNLVDISLVLTPEALAADIVRCCEYTLEQRRERAMHVEELLETCFNWELIGVSISEFLEMATNRLAG